MPRYGLSQIIVSLFIYLIIGGILISFLVALPPFIIAFGVLAFLVAVVLSVIRVFRSIFAQRQRPGTGNNEGNFDEYGSRRTTATVIDMKDSPGETSGDKKDKPSGEGK